MRHITLTCPSCAAPEKAVGHPHGDGHQGEFHCFSCGLNGAYTVTFSMVAPVEAPVEDG